MADWEQALERQAATWAFCVSEAGQRYLTGFAESVGDESVPRMSHAVLSTLWNADPVYITPDMCALLFAAWPMFGDEPLHEDDLFIPDGFAYLPRSITINDWRDKPVTHRAVSWQMGTTAEGIRALFVCTWASADDAIADGGKFKESDGPMEIDDPPRIRRYFGQSLILNYATVLPFGMLASKMVADATIRHHDGQDQEPEAPKKEAATLQMLRFLQAMWRLMNQRVAVGMTARPTRPVRRRMHETPMHDKYVTVITLRRPRPRREDSEHEAVDWRQRWIVSGHWRWQPYGDGTHKQIWIAPYVKGPEDKPLVVRGARVFRWKR